MFWLNSDTRIQNFTLCYSIFYSQYVFISLMLCTMISLFSTACIVLILSCTFPSKAPSGSVLTPLGSVLKLPSVEFKSSLRLSVYLLLKRTSCPLLSPNLYFPSFPLHWITSDLTVSLFRELNRQRICLSTPTRPPPTPWSIYLLT